MYKVAVLGDKDSICGFASIGLETYPVSDKKQAQLLFKSFVKENYAVIYITEYYADFLKEDIEKIKDSITPAVILIPGISGNTGEGMNSVSRSVERAVGSQILD